MQLFGICIVHDWMIESIYYDCSDICMWSSGTMHYRKCRHCGKTEQRRWNADEWEKGTHKDIVFREEAK